MGRLASLSVEIGNVSVILLVVLGKTAVATALGVSALGVSALGSADNFWLVCTQDLFPKNVLAGGKPLKLGIVGATIKGRGCGTAMSPAAPSPPLLQAPSGTLVLRRPNPRGGRQPSSPQN